MHQRSRSALPLAAAARGGGPARALAREYPKAATGPALQKADIFGTDGWTPVSTRPIAQTAGSLRAAQSFDARPDQALNAAQ